MRVRANSSIVHKVRYWIVFTFLTLISPINSFSQDISTSTIKWSYSSIKDLNTEITTEAKSFFITYPSDKIEWVQKNGTRTYTLEVTSSEGNWNDISSFGAITYHIKFREGQGLIEINRNDDGLFLFLELNDFGGAPAKFKFVIQSSGVL